MKKFDTLTAVAAPLPLINVDTDMIIPARFLKTIKRTGLGKSLFTLFAMMKMAGSGRVLFSTNPPIKTQRFW